MRRFGIPLFALAALGATSAGADPPDLEMIERQIANEPQYTSDRPLYGLYVFGPQAQTRVWAVADKSEATKEFYDVLYFDRDADGDLTDAGERIAGERDNGGRVTFEIGTFTDPETGDEHTELVITRREDGSMFLRMSFRGKHVVRGGYAEQSGPYCRFEPSREEAPVLWPGAEGHFSFQRWIWTDLRVGQADDASVFMGHRGHGKNTFCAVSQDFLPPDAAVLATLIYTDTDGKEQRARSELRERC